MCIYACAYIQYLREETRCLRQEKLQTEIPGYDVRVKGIRMNVLTQRHRSPRRRYRWFKCCAVVSQCIMMVEPGCYALAKVANRNTGPAFLAGNSTRDRNAIVNLLISPSRAIGTYLSYTTYIVLRTTRAGKPLLRAWIGKMVLSSVSFPTNQVVFHCMPFFPSSCTACVPLLYQPLHYRVLVKLLLWTQEALAFHNTIM